MRRASKSNTAARIRGSGSSVRSSQPGNTRDSTARVGESGRHGGGNGGAVFYNTPLMARKSIFTTPKVIRFATKMRPSTAWQFAVIVTVWVNVETSPARIAGIRIRALPVLKIGTARRILADSPTQRAIKTTYSTIQITCLLDIRTRCTGHRE